MQMTSLIELASHPSGFTEGCLIICIKLKLFKAIGLLLTYFAAKTSCEKELNP